MTSQVRTLKSHPLPWRVFDGGRYTIEIQDANGKAVVPWPGFDDSDKSMALRQSIANHIVRCVNYYGGESV